MVGEDTVHWSFGEYIDLYYKQNSDAMKGVRNGLADVKAGKIKSWQEIKKELGLQYGCEPLVIDSFI